MIVRKRWMAVASVAWGFLGVVGAAIALLSILSAETAIEPSEGFTRWVLVGGLLFSAAIFLDTGFRSLLHLGSQAEPRSGDSGAV